MSLPTIDQAVEAILLVGAPVVGMMILAHLLLRWFARLAAEDRLVPERVDVLLSCGHVRVDYPTSWALAPSVDDPVACDACQKVREADASVHVLLEDL